METAQGQAEGGGLRPNRPRGGGSSGPPQDQTSKEAQQLHTNAPHTRESVRVSSV